MSPIVLIKEKSSVPLYVVLDWMIAWHMKTTVRPTKIFIVLLRFDSDIDYISLSTELVNVMC